MLFKFQGIGCRIFYGNVCIGIALMSAMLFSFATKADDSNVDSLKKVIRFSKYSIAKADAYVQLSEIAYLSNMDSVIPLCNEAIRILNSDVEDSSDKAKSRISEIKAHALNNIGSVFYTRGNLPRALDYYLEGLKLREESGDKMGLAESYNNLGVLYKTQGDKNKAIEYYKKSLKLYTDVNNTEGQAIALGNIGTLYSTDVKMDTIRNDSALTYFLRSYRLENNIGNKQGTVRALNNIATIYQKLGKYDDALKYCNQSLDLLSEINDKDEETNTLYIMAQIEFDKNDIEKASQYGVKALNISRDLGLQANVMDEAKLMYQVYSAQRKWEDALNMHLLYSAIRDSVNSEEMRKQDLQKEFQFEYNQKEANMRAIQEKKDLMAQAESKRQRIAILLAVIIALSTGVIAILIFRSLRTTRKQKVIIEEQKMLVEQKNKDILDSITYAKRLQDAILPPFSLIEHYLPESFVLYKPKDIVAGDFYWMERTGNSILIAAADCTGHGVPGAMVSVVCSNSLNRAVREFNITEPGKILDKTRDLVIETFQKSGNDVKDGMDISLCKIEIRSKDKVANTKDVAIDWAGANTPLWYMKHDEIIEIAANMQPIGLQEGSKEFTTHKITLDKGDTIYLYTDGYADQFGGPKDKKFKYNPLRELIKSINRKSMKEQKQKLDEEFEKWKGNREQTDDVCLIAIRI